MNIEILNKLNLLNDKIKYHNFKYHSQDDPEITDFEYDKLCKQYDDIIISKPEFSFLERKYCLLYTSPSPRDGNVSRMPSSA